MTHTYVITNSVGDDVVDADYFEVDANEGDLILYADDRVIARFRSWYSIVEADDYDEKYILFDDAPSDADEPWHEGDPVDSESYGDDDPETQEVSTGRALKPLDDASIAAILKSLLG